MEYNARRSPMTPARFQTIEEIFLAALEHEPGQVSAFLDTACEGDEALRREVEVLLASDQRAGRFIERSTVGLATKIIQKGQGDSLVGQTIGHYKISESIGTGGMGEVYLATDIVAGRKAALKLLPLRFTGDTERLKRFQQEAHAVVGLNHPNILTVYEIGEDHSIHYIASELIEGETLRERLTRGRMQLSEAVDVAIQVASALAAAHHAGIVHRDIKPENIMLRPDGYVKVLDFGIAKLAEQELPTTMPRDEALLLVETNLGSVLGTVRYMSPEQAFGAQVDKSTDIWSLGVVLYEMVTGHTPFTGDTPREVMSSILEKEPPQLTTYVAHIPAELQQIVSKTLRKDREERYRSAHDLLEALKGLRHKLEVEAELYPSTATPSWLRWTRSTALVLGLLVAAMAVAVPFYWHRNLTTSSPPEKSIAVLPFLDLSETKDQEYFCDGMSEEIIDALAKVEGLRVVARASSFSFKGKTAAVSEIGKKLNVEDVLEGSLRREGNRVRITAELINARSGFRIWSDTYERELQRVFALQDEITRAIVDALKIKLAVALPAREQRNTEVYDLYLQGLFFSNKSSEEDLRRALSFFQRAVEKDPTFSSAWTGIAKVWYFLADVYLKPLEAYPLSREAAMKAIELDERDAEAHCYLSEAKRVLDWDLTGADAPERTLALDGYEGSRPVRVGNGAAEQAQLDIYGDVMQMAWLYADAGRPIDREFGDRLASVADLVCDIWSQPDSGIWEIRGRVRQYTQSKMMCWVALDRASRLATSGQIPSGDVERWRAEADSIASFVESRCWSTSRQSYTQAADSEELDASVLLGAKFGYGDPAGTRFSRTIDAIRRELGRGPFLYRYLSDDDLRGEEGTFLCCSFWLAEVLGLAGRREEAIDLLDDLVGFENDVGLYAEEIDPSTSAFLGNFPQALTHLALISAATSLTPDAP